MDNVVVSSVACLERSRESLVRTTEMVGVSQMAIARSLELLGTFAIPS
jgi:hypothetical protein